MSKLQAKNEAVINAPISKIWALITDIDKIHLTNPGVVKASGTMNRLNGTRTCEINNKGRSGFMTERLIELIPEKKTVWTIEKDNMGMGKMLLDTKFCFSLEKLDVNKTRLTSESYYQPANLVASFINVIMMKRMMSKLQSQILTNIKSISEKLR